MSRKLLFLFVLLSVLFIGTIGFGSTTSANAHSTQKETLPDTLVWVSPFNQVEATITDQASVQALYEAFYALPHIPAPSQYLLAHEGVGPASFSYTLQFFAHHHLLKQVELQTMSLNGLELAPHDYRQVTKHFWSVFTQTFHGYKLVRM